MSRLLTARTQQRLATLISEAYFKRLLGAFEGKFAFGRTAVLVETHAPCYRHSLTLSTHTLGEAPPPPEIGSSPLLHASHQPRPCSYGMIWVQPCSTQFWLVSWTIPGRFIAGLRLFDTGHTSFMLDERIPSLPGIAGALHTDGRIDGA